MITQERKLELIKEFRTKDQDVGSSPVQVAILTERIRNLTEHLKANKKDHATRRGLMKLVGRRTRLLRYVRRHDQESYKDLIGRLNIRR